LAFGDERFGHDCLHSVSPSSRGRGGVRPALSSVGVRPYTVRCGVRLDHAAAAASIPIVLVTRATNAGTVVEGYGVGIVRIIT
jgi:hypothetical protein